MPVTGWRRHTALVKCRSDGVQACYAGRLQLSHVDRPRDCARCAGFVGSSRFNSPATLDALASF